MERTIVNVRNYQTGEELYSYELFETLNEKEIFDLRTKLSKIARTNQSILTKLNKIKWFSNKTNLTIKDYQYYLNEFCKKFQDKYLVCAFCNQEIIHSGRPNLKKAEITNFFKHYKDTLDCPIITKHKYSQIEINAMKYNGAKESFRHKELKNFIYNQIKKDDRFKNEAMERVVKSFKEKKLWRKPDVSSEFLDKKIVFEIQLQTTFLNVIRDREDFYKSNETYIMWFFNNTNVEKFRFSEKDIFYANKSNAFVISNETMKLSIKENKFLFYCYYQIPYMSNDKINYKWIDKLITIDDLKFDNENYKVFYYDLDVEEEKLKNDILKNKILSKQKNKQKEKETETETEKEKENIELKYNFWFDFEQLDIYSDFNNINNKYSNNIFNTKITKELAVMIYSLYSLKKKKIYGFNFKSFNSLSNNLLEHYKQFSYIFLWAIEIYGLKEFILKNDKNGYFQKKIERYKTERSKNRDYIQENKYNKMLSILFPELKEKLKV